MTDEQKESMYEAWLAFDNFTSEDFFDKVCEESFCAGYKAALEDLEKNEE